MIEHAILEGNSDDIARGLQALYRLRQQGNEKSAMEIEARIAKDFNRINIDVHFSAEGSVDMNRGVPWGIIVDKDGACYTYFHSGKTDIPIIDEDRPVVANKVSTGLSTSQNKQSSTTPAVNWRSVC